MLLGPPSSVVVSAYKDEDENEEGASVFDVAAAAGGGGLFPPRLLVDLVVVVDMAVRGVVDAAVCGVAIGDCLSDEPSEMEMALVPPQPHMNPRAFFLMHSTRPAAPRRRDSNTLMDGRRWRGRGRGRARAVRRSMPPDRRLRRPRPRLRSWGVCCERKRQSCVCWGEEEGEALKRASHPSGA